MSLKKLRKQLTRRRPDFGSSRPKTPVGFSTTPIENGRVLLTLGPEDCDCPICRTKKPYEEAGLPIPRKVLERAYAEVGALQNPRTKPS